MARFFSRKKEEEPEHRSEPEAEDVQLDGEDHAWWSQQDVADVWRPREAITGNPDAAERDILAEHFGEDWRTTFEFTPPTEEELEEERRREQQAVDDQDPYKVLGIEPTATWEEIVQAHRDMARSHHPDRLFGQSEEEIAESEDRIRVINQAYGELRVRRGK